MNGYRLMIKNIFILSFFSVLVACSGSDNSENSLNELNDFKVTQEDLASMLKTKGLADSDGKRQERLKSTYIERNAIAAIVVKDPVIDLPAVRFQIKRNRNEMLIKNYFDQYLKTASSPDAVKKYYDENIDEFTDKKVHLAHILIKLSATATVNEKAEAHKKAINIADEVRRGASFEKLVRQHSDDNATKNKAGDLNWLQAESIERNIFDKAISLKMEDIPTPILTSRGYHIIKLVEPVEKKVKPLDEVKEKIAYKLKYEAKVNELKRLKELAKSTM